MHSPQHVEDTAAPIQAAELEADNTELTADLESLLLDTNSISDI
jgi:hypothetical protein